MFFPSDFHIKSAIYTEHYYITLLIKSQHHLLSSRNICCKQNTTSCHFQTAQDGVFSHLPTLHSRLEPSSATEACKARTVYEQVLQSVIVKAINKMLSDQQNYLSILQKNITTVIKSSNATSEKAIDQRLIELQKEIISKANNKEAYDTIADEIFRLRELKHQSEIDGVTRDEHIKRISELHDFITQNPQTELTEFDEALVRRLLQKVTVYDDYYTVKFKSGVGVDVVE